MSNSLKTRANNLVKVINEFVKLATQMYQDGKISKDEYDNMIDKKLRFVDAYNNGEIVSFDEKENKKAI